MTRSRQKKQEQHMLSCINIKKKKKGEGGHKIYNKITHIGQTGKRDGERNATLLRPDVQAHSPGP